MAFRHNLRGMCAEERSENHCLLSSYDKEVIHDRVTTVVMLVQKETLRVQQPHTVSLPPLVPLLSFSLRARQEDGVTINNTEGPGKTLTTTNREELRASQGHPSFRPTGPKWRDFFVHEIHGPRQKRRGACVVSCSRFPGKPKGYLIRVITISPVMRINECKHCETRLPLVQILVLRSLQSRTLASSLFPLRYPAHARVSWLG